MREFFHEKLQLPVEFFNPLRNVSVASELDLESIGHHAHSMGELVGLALRGFLSCPMELNLRPAKVVRRHRLAEQRPALILAGLCFLLALAGWWLYYDRAAAATEEALNALNPKVTTLQDFEGRMKTVRNQIKAQQDAAAPLLHAIDDRAYWATILNDINSRLPEDYVWLIKFDIVPPPKTPVMGVRPGQPDPNAPSVMLHGLYLANPRKTEVVEDFLNAMAKSDLYTVQKDKWQRTEPDESSWAWEWSVPLTLKNPIALPATRTP
jgi:Tfp pilus assembly protein PilN